MVRLWKIEWIKLWPNRSFRWFMGLFFAGMILLLSSPKMVVFGPMRMFSYETLSFPVVWQNLGFIAAYFANIILAIWVINYVSNEFTYRTMRQHVIEGMSKLEVLMGKLIMFFSVTIVATLFLIITGIIVGMVYSDNVTFNSVFQSMELMAGYFVHTMAIMSFAGFLAVLIKRSGLALTLFLLYILLLENILRYYLPDFFGPYLPVYNFHSIFTWSMFELQSGLEILALLLTAFYGLAFLGASYWLILKRNL